VNVADALSPIELAAAGALRALLADVGYAALYHQFVSPTLFAPGRAAATRSLGALERPERPLLELLALGGPVDEAELRDATPGDGPSATLAPALAALLDAGLLVARGRALRTEGWVVVPALGGLLMTGVPPTYEAAEAVGAAAYVGFDSLRLAAVLPRTAGRRVLDLGAGCGVQGLLAAGGATEAVLSDVDARSLRVAAFNAELNEVAHRVTLRCGDLYQAVVGERFDLIVILPPYVPTVQGSGTSGTVAGGPDGLGMIRRVVSGAAEALYPGGELVALCQLLCDDRGPLLAGELGELAPGLDVRLAVDDWHPLQPYLVELATSLAGHRAGAPPTERAALIERYGRSLRPLGVTGVCTAVLRLRRPLAGRAARPARVVGRAPAVRATDRPVPVEGLSFEPPSGVSLARVGEAPAGLLEDPTVALVRAATGGGDVRAVAAAGWGHMAGASEEDLVDQAVHRLMGLEAQGLIGWSPVTDA
jgi:hypothetical protein